MSREHLIGHVTAYLSATLDELSPAEQVIVELFATGFDKSEPRLATFIDEGADAYAIGQVVGTYLPNEPAVQLAISFTMDQYMDGDNLFDVFTALETFHTMTQEDSE